MSIVNVDTIKLKQTANTLNSLNKRYIGYINNIKDIASKDNYWKGEDGDNFRSDIKNTCAVYDEVASILKQYALFLESYANDVERFVSLGKIK